MRTHPIVGDSLLAVLLGLIDLLVYIAAIVERDTPASTWITAILVSVAVVSSLIFRRKYPQYVAYTLLVFAFIQAAIHLGSSAALASAIALYTLIVYLDRRRAFYYLIAVIIESVLEFAITIPRQEWVTDSLIAVLGLAFCWVLGEFVGARRAYQTELEARLHLLETERDQAARIVISEERTRIARELHDVVAHSVSVMVVQANGASYMVKNNPELAESAIKTIAETGRGALIELRNLVEVLREQNGAELREPQPDAGSITELVERIRVAGVPVELEIERSLSDLPTGISLGIYRIVQESLTNVLKHAGPGARAGVKIHRGNKNVEIQITDDGAGKAHELSQSANNRPLPGGNGLIGMRERAHVFGGQLEVGPQPGGGWRVSASLPIKLAT
jgi:signal transduction histidine kinase